MTEVVVKEIDNEEPKEETIPEPIQEEAPKEEEKPEEIVETPVQEKPQPATVVPKPKRVSQGRNHLLTQKHSKTTLYSNCRKIYRVQ